MSGLKKFKNINFKSKAEVKKEKSKNLAFGVLLGTAIGAIAGVFSQTDTGKKATKEVVNKAKDIKDKSKVVASDSLVKIKEVKGKLSDKINKKSSEEPEAIESSESE
jgi:gas vesicle protein